jgi:sugar/nucleoside kinase (ribokinase family)
MPFEIQRELIRHLATRPGTFVSVDPHEPVREENLAMWREALADVDAFFPSEDELLLDGADRDPSAALPRLGAGRLKLVAHKRGARGGVLYEREANRFTEWSAIEGPSVDWTGAGDAFAGGFMGYLARTNDLSEANLRRAVIYGSAMGSFAVEKFSIERLLEVDTKQLAARVADFRKLVAFEEEL